MPAGGTVSFASHALPPIAVRIVVHSPVNGSVHALLEVHAVVHRPHKHEPASQSDDLVQVRSQFVSPPTSGAGVWL
jgi:hypothetical protein